MKAIWKFPLSVTDLQELSMPEGAEILSAQFQGKTLCLWAKVDPSSPRSVLFVRITGTGNPFDDEAARFIGTAQGPFGLVWHVFEVTP